MHPLHQNFSNRGPSRSTPPSSLNIFFLSYLCTARQPRRDDPIRCQLTYRSSSTPLRPSSSDGASDPARGQGSSNVVRLRRRTTPRQPSSMNSARAVAPKHGRRSRWPLVVCVVGHRGGDARVRWDADEGQEEDGLLVTGRRPPDRGGPPCLRCAPPRLFQPTPRSFSHCAGSCTLLCAVVWNGGIFTVPGNCGS